MVPIKPSRWSRAKPSLSPVGLPAGDTEPVPCGRTLFGCNAKTLSPASSSRSTSSPSGRSIATSETSSRTSVRHNDASPFSSWRMSRRAPRSGLLSHQHVVLLRRPIDPRIPAAHRRLSCQIAFTAPRPRGTVADAHRQGPHSSGLRPVAARGTSPPSGRAGLWQALQPRASNRGPLPAAVEATTACPMSHHP